MEEVKQLVAVYNDAYYHPSEEATERSILAGRRLRELLPYDTGYGMLWSDGTITVYAPTDSPITIISG